MNSEKSIFQRPFWVVTFALSAAISWGWAYPLIKLGFDEFGIMQSMTGSKMLFAGIRFFISGVLILCIARFFKRDFRIRNSNGVWYILLYALLNTTLHYAFFYIGLSHSDGARAAILNSLGVFMLVLLACVFFKSDKLTTKKMLAVDAPEYLELAEGDKQALVHLVKAASILDDVFLQQDNQDNLSFKNYLLKEI